MDSPLTAGVTKLSYRFASSHKYIPRRAVLYVPADDERKIQKIPSLNVDCAVLDCEDGVALNRKVIKNYLCDIISVEENLWKNVTFALGNQQPETRLNLKIYKVA